MTTRDRYTGVAILLHWLIAALVVGNLALATAWEFLVPEKDAGPLFTLHMSFGISVFGLMLLRLLWRGTHRPPPMSARYARWETRLARGVHTALYVVTFAVPLAGWIMISAHKHAAESQLLLYGAIPFPKLAWAMALDPVARERMHERFEQLHGLGAWVLVLLIALHIAGALKHQLIDREPELQRMWPGSNDGG